MHTLIIDRRKGWIQHDSAHEMTRKQYIYFHNSSSIRLGGKLGMIPYILYISIVLHCGNYLLLSPWLTMNSSSGLLAEWFWDLLFSSIASVVTMETNVSSTEWRLQRLACCSFLFLTNESLELWEIIQTACIGIGLKIKFLLIISWSWMNVNILLWIALQ